MTSESTATIVTVTHRLRSLSVECSILKDPPRLKSLISKFSASHVAIAYGRESSGFGRGTWILLLTVLASLEATPDRAQSAEDHLVRSYELGGGLRSVAVTVKRVSSRSTLGPFLTDHLSATGTNREVGSQLLAAVGTCDLLDLNFSWSTPTLCPQEQGRSQNH